MQLIADDSVTHADFKSMTAACNEEIQAAEAEIAELERDALEGEEFRKRSRRSGRCFPNAQRDAASGIITKEFVDKYIDKIFVTPQSDDTLLLQIKIFTGETTEKYLRKFKSRAGIITGDMAEQGKKQGDTIPFGRSGSCGSHVQEDDRELREEPVRTSSRIERARPTGRAFLRSTEDGTLAPRGRLPLTRAEETKGQGVAALADILRRISAKIHCCIFGEYDILFLYVCMRCAESGSHARKAANRSGRPAGICRGDVRMRAWEHFKTITRHRRLVRRYCFRLGLYAQGIRHDLSKYSPRNSSAASSIIRGIAARTTPSAARTA